MTDEMTTFMLSLPRERVPAFIDALSAEMQLRVLFKAVTLLMLDRSNTIYPSNPGVEDLRAAFTAGALSFSTMIVTSEELRKAADIYLTETGKTHRG